ncbi:chemosensory receptor C [Elysia marginata]|uniref:Chemosensory receptor C n=1 Tax=Elysia marginata TaxID=1093978 RepID=A0AAV4GA13_9GAST|nr:chemosensory receptor C [Elysia marginata]
MSTNVTKPSISLVGWFFFNEFLITRKFIFHIMMCVATFGVISNAINILVFVKMKLKDNVSITLLFLSISDLMYVLMRSPETVLLLLEETNPHLRPPPHIGVLMLGLSFIYSSFYDYSMFVSLFLAIARCACVARPLRFKSTFNKSRTLVILGVLFFAAMGLLCISCAALGVTWAVDPNTNSTYILFWVRDTRLVKISDILNRNVLALLTYITAITCVVILASKLQAASKFRQSSARSGESAKVETVIPIAEPSKFLDPSNHSESSENIQKSPSKGWRMKQSLFSGVLKGQNGKYMTKSLSS